VALNIGIVGLPNVGKSTTFNALTRAPKRAGSQLSLSARLSPTAPWSPCPTSVWRRCSACCRCLRRSRRRLNSWISPGWCAGASQGEGLGNQFLGNIRDADAIVHVVRCFDDPSVVHISEKPAPRDDVARWSRPSCMLADLEQLERKLERLERQAKGDVARFWPAARRRAGLQAHLAAGEAAATFAGAEEAFQELNREMRFLTRNRSSTWPMSTSSLEWAMSICRSWKRWQPEQGVHVITLCARLEEELAGLDEEERRAFLALAGASESGLDQVIRLGYELLNLISYFSYNQNEVRAWTIAEGLDGAARRGRDSHRL
jgi:ribosome-binding ATPase